jgi:hypothetical protein
MTEMQSSTVSYCWAVTNKRTETGSEIWGGGGNSTITVINCLETAVPHVLCVLQEHMLMNDINRLIGFYMIPV